MTLTFARRRLTMSARMSSAERARPLRIRESCRLTPRTADRRPVDEELVPPRPRPSGTRSSADRPGPAPPSALSATSRSYRRGSSADHGATISGSVSNASRSLAAPADRPAPARLVDRGSGAVPADRDLQAVRPPVGVEVDDVHTETERPHAVVGIPVRVDVTSSPLRKPSISASTICDGAGMISWLIFKARQAYSHPPKRRIAKSGTQYVLRALLDDHSKLAQFAFEEFELCFRFEGNAHACDPDINHLVV